MLSLVAVTQTQAAGGTSVVTAIIGGSVGFLLGLIFSQAARARAAWTEIELHDEEARERNARLVVWVDDRTRRLLVEMEGITNDHAARGLL